ncbi:hypothetical protein QQS21_002028 [Conoideocrella luteorostrata]|uniref:Peptidase S8/S53 domain-containing protein n=1 Tax=Conoideocrella luteorostrata TaxID=1105319 RepID=A0AAJ0FWX3_9HYPO|nr:hypothetical protein QQS21_002028 [Conoideocrella luteorostrata]
MSELTGKHARASIRDTAGSCLDLFASVLQANDSALDVIQGIDAATPQPDHGRLRIERDRFRIWAANSAAFAEGRGSLDFRLRELPDELDQVRSLLGTISSRLSSYGLALANKVGVARINTGLAGAESVLAIEHAEIGSKSGVPGRSSGTDEDPAPEVDKSPMESKVDSNTALFRYDEALEAIHTSIDWLHRLSNLLRKASVVNQNLHAQSYCIPGVDAEGLKSYFSWVVRRDFPGLSEQLKGRMASTMVERHRRVLYRRERYGAGWKQEQSYRREEKVAAESEKIMKVGSLSPDSIDPIASTSTHQDPPEAGPPSKEASSLYSRGAVTEPDRSRYYAPSSIATGRSAALDHDAEILLPSPPPTCQTEQNFTCDLCCMILDSRVGKELAQWRKHVKQDLDAYVCLFDRCDRPFDIFSTNKEWLRHMRSEHLVKWVCPATDHGTVEFGTKEELTAHMEQAHCDTFSPELLPYMMDSCCQTSEVVFEACPFCDKTHSAMETHVGHHLRYLALKSIPWPDGDNDIEEETEDDDDLVVADKDVDRETLGQSFGSLESGSIYYGDQKSFPIASEYGGNSFFLEPEQQEEWQRHASEPRDVDDDRQAEWGFIRRIFDQHKEWRAIMNHEQVFNTKDPTKKPEKAPHSDWFQHMDKLTSLMTPREDEQDELYRERPVRIAILGSGISSEAESHLSNRFAGGRTFFDDELTWNADPIGHGSRAATIIARICISSRIFVARLTNTGTFHKDDMLRIAKVMFLSTFCAVAKGPNTGQAIYWAADLRVDIILMSCNMSAITQDIMAAIDQAAKRGILMFSPMVNTGRSISIRFPSNTTDVFGVFAANSDGKLFEFSPRAPASLHDFSFPREGMEGLLPETSGGDNAAAVAAGVAGNLLDFFRQPLLNKPLEAPSDDVYEHNNLKHAALSEQLAAATESSSGKLVHAPTEDTPEQPAGNEQSAADEELATGNEPTAGRRIAASKEITGANELSIHKPAHSSATAPRNPPKLATSGQNIEDQDAAKEAAEAVEAADKEPEAPKKRLQEETKASSEEADKNSRKAPIEFKDAVGRKFSFPFHLCYTWQGIEELIKQAFLQVDELGPHVQQGHYDLFGPNGEIILPSVWERVIQPGWSITMTMWPLNEAPPIPSRFPGTRNTPHRITLPKLLRISPYGLGPEILEQNGWFVIERGIPAPNLENMAGGGHPGPLSLGHIIANLKDLDKPLNLDNIMPFPKDMEIWRKTELQGEFADNSYKFTAHLCRPPRSYVADCLESPSIASYIKNSRSFRTWTLFMITGLYTARNLKLNVGHQESADLQFLPSHLGFSGQAQLEAAKGVETSIDRVVFAVRLVKISKSFLSRDWTMKEEAKGTLL